MPTQTAPVRIGVIGAGAHAQRSHIEPLSDISVAELVAVADPSEDALDWVTDNHPGVRIYRDAEEMLQRVRLDAVVIASPDRFHVDHLEMALAAGLAALVEKPMAQDEDQYVRLEAALLQAEREHLVVSSCYPRHFDPPFLYYYEERDAYRNGLGLTLHLDFDFCYHRPTKEGLHTGLLMDHVGHELDLANWYFGESKTTLYRLYDSDTRYAVAGVREDGITMSFHGSRTLERHVYLERFRVRHAGGTVMVDCATGDVRVDDLERRESRLLNCGGTDYGRRFHDLNRNFVRAVLGQEESYLSRDTMLQNTLAGSSLTTTGIFRS
jgi:predicted dehydrogenase